MLRDYMLDPPEDDRIGEDFLGNLIYPEDDMYYYEDMSFVKSEISNDLKELLEIIGERGKA